MPLPAAPPTGACTTESDSQRSDAPPLAVKVSVTGPGAARGGAPKVIGTTAPAVVVTPDGVANVSAGGAAAAVGVCWFSEAVVLTFEPSERVNVTLRVVAPPR